MGISKPSQSCAKHQKDMAVLYSRVFPFTQTALRRYIEGSGAVVTPDSKLEFNAISAVHPF
jgi:hypothetical protein